jgi:hypothetical protein
MAIEGLGRCLKNFRNFPEDLVEAGFAPWAEAAEEEAHQDLVETGWAALPKTLQGKESWEGQISSLHPLWEEFPYPFPIAR